jgi:hypothetical protein
VQISRRAGFTGSVITGLLSRRRLAGGSSGSD